MIEISDVVRKLVLWDKYSEWLSSWPDGCLHAVQWFPAVFQTDEYKRLLKVTKRLIGRYPKFRRTLSDQVVFEWGWRKHDDSLRWDVFRDWLLDEGYDAEVQWWSKSVRWKGPSSGPAIKEAGKRLDQPTADHSKLLRNRYIPSSETRIKIIIR